MGCNDSRYIDLHIHSTASDGSLTPREILDLARRLDLGAVAITDHDTLAGSQEALSGGIPAGCGFLTGIEISTQPPPEYPAAGSFHVLGYGIRLDDPALNSTVSRLQQARNNRNPCIIDKLNALGLPVSLQEAAACGSDSQLGRPHIAEALVRKGLVGSIQEAFDRYLGTGKPAYVDKYRIACQQAIALIGAAGGVAVLAHPGLLQTHRGPGFETLLDALIDMGLRGIEVAYSDHSPELTAYYHELAQRRRLIKTGGTDFHGSLKPDVRLGAGRGGLRVPFDWYQELLRHI